MNDVRVIPRTRRDRLGEGLLWSEREGAVYWTDILGRHLNRLRLADGAVDEWAMPDTIGWVVEREDAPGLIAGIGRAFVALTLDPLNVELIAAPEPERVGNRFNDGAADGRGRIWAGSMRRDGTGSEGAFYRLDPDGRVTRVDDGYGIANGPAISPDDRWMFHTDTARDTIFRLAIRDDGTLGAREPFVTFEAGEGHPDGMTLDADGCLWVACWGAGQVVRLDPTGRRERAITLPASQVSNVAFAGPSLDRMFVTSAADGVDEPLGGALFEVDPGCCGLTTRRYRG